MADRTRSQQYLYDNYTKHNNWKNYPLSERGVASIMEAFASKQCKQQREDDGNTANDFGRKYDLELSNHLVSEVKKTPLVI